MISGKTIMSDYIVYHMQEGNISEIRNYIQTIDSINDYVYTDEENCLTMLHLAAGLDSIHRDEVIEIIIQHEADLNRSGKSENIDGVRPLHLAAMWGYDLTVKLLLYHGADASLRDSSKLSPIDYASIFDNYMCISLLLRYGCLNASAAAWEAIWDSSLGNCTADTSLDEHSQSSSFH